MAAEAENREYESDPDESPLPLAMRRREASDDEEGQDGGVPRMRDRRLLVHSDEESDGQGGAEVYAEDESEAGDGCEEELVEAEEEFEEQVGEGPADARGVDDQPVSLESETDNGISGADHVNHLSESLVQEKKKNEPFSVPTAGAFYMHDDRFRDNGGGRHRRTLGGRKLWESKDDRAWVHDRFEELNLQNTHYEEAWRNRKDHFRGRGRNRGPDHHGYVKENRAGVYDGNSIQNCAPKGVRGRGPRKYEPSQKISTKARPVPNKQTGKPLEKTTSKLESGVAPAHTPSIQNEVVAHVASAPWKHVFASSLSSASPPFYPSGSSNQDISVMQKSYVPTIFGTKNASSPGPLGETLSSTLHSNTLLRGKTTANTVGQDRVRVGDSTLPVSAETGTTLHHATTSQSQKPKAQVGRGLTISSPHIYVPISSPNTVNRISVQSHLSMPLKPTQDPAQPSLRSSNQQADQQLASGNASPFQVPSVTMSEVRDVESPPGSNKSKTALAGKGSSVQSSFKGSFLFNDSQVVGGTGAIGVDHDDQNFPATPALLPVMQFGGQHPGGLGVPAVGMALPGYVTQPQLGQIGQLGLRKSEMTWFPVLASAVAGALGATHRSPYMAVDGGYYACPFGQASSMSISKETTPNIYVNNMWKPPQKPDLRSDDFGRRQNKPRRYSEMNFGQ